MQQFGFSATDVKLKQWDETQNSAATQTFIQPWRYPLADAFQLSAKASSLSQKPLPKQPSENTSFWGKLPLR